MVDLGQFCAVPLGLQVCGWVLIWSVPPEATRPSLSVLDVVVSRCPDRLTSRGWRGRGLLAYEPVNVFHNAPNAAARSSAVHLFEWRTSADPGALAIAAPASSSPP